MMSVPSILHSQVGPTRSKWPREILLLHGYWKDQPFRRLGSHRKDNMQHVKIGGNPLKVFLGETTLMICSCCCCCGFGGSIFTRDTKNLLKVSSSVSPESPQGRVHAWRSRCCSLVCLATRGVRVCR